MSASRSIISVKALLSGSLTILVLGLLMQLLFVAIAVGQLIFTRHFPGLEWLAQGLLYLCGLLLLLLTMAGGGYVAAWVASERLYLHAALAALIGGGISFVQSLGVGGLTLTGVLLFLLGVPFALAGSWLRQRQLKYSA
ncbi:MAG: hypothetical protein OQL28_09125 [Sedimenticola sp.]|nr:hypothetical protein [Sedimenticola sp.]